MMLMNNELEAVICSFRESGAYITDAEANTVKDICLRKAELTDKAHDNGYFVILFKDEIKNYLLRRYFSGISEIYRKEKECVLYAE